MTYLKVFLFLFALFSSSWLNLIALDCYAASPLKKIFGQVELNDTSDIWYEDLYVQLLSSEGDAISEKTELNEFGAFEVYFEKKNRNGAILYVFENDVDNPNPDFAILAQRLIGSKNIIINSKTTSKILFQKDYISYYEKN